MRKHILIGLLLCLSLNLMAQDSQWFAQANFTWNAWYGVGEKSLVAPTLNEQVMFNISSLLLGHNPYRLWNCIPYIGAGLSRNMSAAHYTSDINFGILNTFRLTPKLAANFELGWNSYEGNGGIALKDRLQQITFEFGLTWCFGTSKAKKKAEAEAIESLSEGEIDALNAQLADLEAENEQLRKELEEAKKQK